MDFELIIDSNLELIETPVWDPRINSLYWTDLFKGDVHMFNPETGVDLSYPTGKMIGAAIPSSNPDKLLCALEDGMYLLDKSNGSLTFLVNPEPCRDENRFNDTRVDARGRIFTSTVSKKYGTGDYRPEMLGGFYMIDTDHSVKIIEKEVNQYNTIVWNKRSTIMFVVDTFHECLMAYPYDILQGPIGPGNVVMELKEYGMPDGMSIDSEDNLYICHWTKKITVWSPGYQLIEVIEIPVEFACCTGFAGKDLKDLYVATSKYGYTGEQIKENPGAGGMFAGRNKIAGTLDHFYKEELFI